MNSIQLEQLYYESKPYLLFVFAVFAIVRLELAIMGYWFSGLLLGLTAIIVFQRTQYRNDKYIKIKK